MAREYYTTTDAARLLSVSADTVLKWVRSGKIRSYRTPGGHARIPREAVEKLLPHSRIRAQATVDRTPEVPYEYCWDFYSDDGTIKEECLDCLVYRSRARRCYEMRDIPELFGLLKLQCNKACADCEYYAIAKKQGRSALIVSRDRDLIKPLEAHKDDAELTLRFASGEYDCAVILDKFRPDYVVVDYSMGAVRSRHICQHLAEDERVPFARVILTSKTVQARESCDRQVLGWIEKPFTFEQLKSCLQGIE
jgi:excisionase family DNA binding protein